jgi:preprotein translocase subunit SecD
MSFTLKPKLPPVSKSLRVFLLILVLAVVAIVIAMPAMISMHKQVLGKNIDFDLKRPHIAFNLFGKPVTNDLDLKQGLDVQGGMQVVLKADMKDIPVADRANALESAKEVIQRRVDLFGVSEPVIQTAQSGDEYRIVVELAGVQDANQALQLIGTTAQLDFRLENASAAAQLASSSASVASASDSAAFFFSQFQPTGLTGKQLKRSAVQFDPKTSEPTVSMEFNDDGRKMFADITKNNTGKVLAIFLDDYPVTMPRINTPILDGQAIITGQFTVDQAKQLSIQLNAGALPVPIDVIQQSTVGASLGRQSVAQSVMAGFIGLGLIILFMILYYGAKGFLASLSLVLYAIFTVATYKLMGVTLTLPGIAGLLLTIGMAVDSNILIFERMKEETRAGKFFAQSMELGFQRAWNSIKDANLTTIMISLILINPLNFTFLNSSGLVRGFGLTLLIGVVMSLFTSMVATKTLMQLFLSEPTTEKKREIAKTSTKPTKSLPTLKLRGEK